MENASCAFLDAVRRSMRPIRTALGATVIDPKLLTAAETLQYEGYLRREDTTAAILALARDGIAIKEIVRRTGHSRKLVRQAVRGERPMFSGHGRARWTRICRSWTSSGRPAAATALSSGVACRRMGSADRCMSSPSGRPDVGGPRRRATGFGVFHPPERSQG